MKRIILLLYFAVFSSSAFSQWSFKPIVNVSHNTFLIGLYKTFTIKYPSYSYTQYTHITGILCQSMNFSGGINLIHNNYNLGIKLNYQYFLARGFLMNEVNVSNKALMKNHLLGLNIVNKFRETRLVQPSFSISFASEVYTNYRNKYLDRKDYYAKISSFYMSNSWSDNINIYHSTPFVGDLLVGCDFRIYKGFSANIGIGYGLRIIRVQYANVTFPAGQQPSTPIKEEKLGKPYSLPLHYMVIQGGLSYAFDVHKKKPKTKEHENK